jgi:hypothetical protein
LKKYIRSVDHMTSTKAMLIGMFIAAIADVVAAIGIWVLVVSH